MRSLFRKRSSDEVHEGRHNKLNRNDVRLIVVYTPTFHYPRVKIVVKGFAYLPVVTTDAAAKTQKPNSKTVTAAEPDRIMFRYIYIYILYDVWKIKRLFLEKNCAE